MRVGFDLLQNHKIQQFLKACMSNDLQSCITFVHLESNLAPNLFIQLYILGWKQFKRGHIKRSNLKKKFDLRTLETLKQELLRQ